MGATYNSGERDRILSVMDQAGNDIQRDNEFQMTQSRQQGLDAFRLAESETKSNEAAQRLASREEWHGQQADLAQQKLSISQQNADLKDTIHQNQSDQKEKDTNDVMKSIVGLSQETANLTGSEDDYREKMQAAMAKYPNAKAIEVLAPRFASLDKNHNLLQSVKPEGIDPLKQASAINRQLSTYQRRQPVLDKEITNLETNNDWLTKTTGEHTDPSSGVSYFGTSKPEDSSASMTVANAATRATRQQHLALLQERQDLTSKTPLLRNKLDTILSGGTPEPDAPAQSNATPVGKTSIPELKDKSEFDQLASGSVYMRNGKRFQKP